MPTLLLVDGSSYLYRAFHALPDLRNKTGEPTGAIYGVINMLRRLAADYKADYRACVFDAKGKTFRDQWYPEYKANRPAMPDDLARQVEPLHDCVRALGWPLLMIEGVEADDVIGTLVRRAGEQGVDCIISTGDKDLAQLVNSRVRLVNTMSNETLDEAGVVAKFGVEPARLVDYFALVGDAVDNVPGVEKVGPKTALKWLQQYDSLDEIIAHADEVGGAVGENLRRAREFLPLGRRLVTVACDVDLPVSVSDLAPSVPDRPRLAELFSRLEFKSWLRELQGSEIAGRKPAEAAGARAEPAGADGARAHRVHYEVILTWEQFERWRERIEAAALTSIDTETTSLDPMEAKLVGISFATAPGEAAYLPLVHRYHGAPAQLPLAEVLERLRAWLESARHRKLGQHTKYDRHVFANHGLALNGVAHDTLLQSYVFESDKGHDLDALAHRHLGLKTIAYDDVTGKGASRIAFEQVEVARAGEYAAEDADIALRVHQALYPRIQAEDKLDRLYREIELPLTDVLFAMERQGVLLDVERLEQQSRELGAHMLEVEAEAHGLARQPFNINSPKQIQEILFEREGIKPVKKTPTGAPSVDEEVLEQLALDYPLPKLILAYRQYAKLKSTYTDKLPRMVNPRTGRVHTTFAQAVAATGRLASNDPNLQNIPIRTEEGRRIRACFIAPPGHAIVSADYSQIELRIMAHLSGDERLLEAFARGEDVHRATAAEVFGVAPQEVSNTQRRYAKVINFGLIYGMSAFGLARNLGLERGAAQAYIDRYFARYPGVARYMEATRSAARDKGYVETVFGRRLWLPEIKSGNPARRQGAERAAINAPMQGTAADLIKLAMIAAQRWLDEHGLGSRLILQVHDELVLEVPEAEISEVRDLVVKTMEAACKLDAPLRANAQVGQNWRDMTAI